MELKIEDLRKMRITKVKPWAINFEYSGEKYLLHEHEEDYETVTTLYKRIPREKSGKYELEYISETLLYIPSVRYANKKGEDGTLSQINKEALVWDLTWRGLIKSMFSKEIKKRKEMINRIKELENQFRLVKRELAEL